MKPLLRIERSTLALAAIGALLYWAALPPLGIAILAFVAPVAWIRLIRFRRLPGRYRYWTLYLVGVLWWLAMLHFLRLPHWSTAIAWVLASLYFGIYLPLFVALGRTAVHRFGISVVLAAPVIWTAFELAKEYILTGCSICALGHTQYATLELIQIADTFGAHGVSFLVMLVAAAIGRTIPLSSAVHPLPEPRDRRVPIWPIPIAIAALILTWFYGHMRMNNLAAESENAGPPWRIVLIQGDVDQKLKTDPKMQLVVQEEYEALTRQAAKEVDRIDLIVWPETMFRFPRLVFPPHIQRDYPAYVSKMQKELNDLEGRARLDRLRTDVGTNLLIGIDRFYVDFDLISDETTKKRVFIPKSHFWNSAMLVLPDGQIAGAYNKQHLVICGEYMPLADRFPWLMNLTPLSINLSSGERAEALAVPGRTADEPPLRVAPNICFESYLSRVIRRQVNELIDRDESPDVLVNMTNDGWFYGSSELDLHLINGVFRAVECRRPFLIAANTGISAAIDPSGRIIEQAERKTSTYVSVDIARSQRSTLYLRTGDVFSGICLVASLIILAIVLVDRRATRKRRIRRRNLRRIFRGSRSAA